MAPGISAIKLKVLYMVPAAIVTLLAIVAAYLHYRYIAVGLLVLASIIILAGSVLYSHLRRLEQEKKGLDEL